MNFQNLIEKLQNILNTYLSIRAYFYQAIPQTIYSNSTLSTYPINYNLLLPASQFNKNLSPGEVGAQIQSYINLCNEFKALINSSSESQTSLFWSTVQNQLEDSITQLNGFAENLLNAEYEKLTKYTIPYDMGLTEAIYLNSLSMDSYAMQASLNYGLSDFNNLMKGTVVVLAT